MQVSDYVHREGVVAPNKGDVLSESVLSFSSKQFLVTREGQLAK